MSDKKQVKLTEEKVRSLIKKKIIRALKESAEQVQKMEMSNEIFEQLLVALDRYDSWLKSKYRWHSSWVDVKNSYDEFEIEGLDGEDGWSFTIHGDAEVDVDFDEPDYEVGYNGGYRIQDATVTIGEVEAYHDTEEEYTEYIFTLTEQQAKGLAALIADHVDLNDDYDDGRFDEPDRYDEIRDWQD